MISLKQYLRNAASSAILGSLGLTPTVWAQVMPPSAGSLLNQIEQSRPAVLPKAAVPMAQEPGAPSTARESSGGVEVILKGIRFEGNQLLSDQQLQAVAKKKLGLALKFNELQDIAQEIAQAYRDAGWVVRAYLPKQDLSDGVLVVNVLEARFGGVQFSGEDNASVALPLLSGRVTAAQPLGAPIRLQALERATLLMEDLPGMGVTTGLIAGPQDNQSSLMVNMAAKPLWGGDVGLDNMGSHATGVNRAVASLNVFSPARLGDQLGFNVAHTAGSDYLRLGYSLPIGQQGWRVGVNASDMKYKLVAPEFASVAGHGQSTSQGLEASYPLLRSRSRNLNLTSSLDRKSFTNWAAGEVTSQYGTRTLSLGLNGHVIDAWMGFGMNVASLSLSGGHVNLDGSPNQAADASAAQTQGHFSKLRYALSRQQSLTAQTTMSVSLTGQRASKNLDSSEKFFLGGGAGVRAFPSGEAGGAEGDMLNVEWRWNIRANLAWAAFVDWGRVQVNKNNDYPGAPALNQIDLKGAGLSLTLNGPPGWTAKGVWARRLGANPNATPAGADQDGTFIKNRLWLQATLSF